VPKSNYKILIVDDDKLMQEILTDRLSREPEFRIFTANNGREGLNAISVDYPDLILLDVQMPIMDGVAMMKEVRQNHNFDDIKVIFLTNFDTDESILKEISEYKPSFYLIKANTNMEDVSRRVKEALGIWKR
jgi:CheY-like chemotaxis protein